jgi:ABC-type lipoprotein release transport system permease subunit
MNRTRLLLRNLFYHWRGNLAVLLGVAVGSAVLIGALLVGDSLAGSLKALTLDQLGWVDQAMVTGRFFRQELAKELPAKRVSPVILLQGSARKDQGAAVGKVTVLGVDQSFWPREMEIRSDMWQAAEAEVALNAALARALKAKLGDTITLDVQKADAMPRESLLGKRKTEDAVKLLKVTVRQILPDEGMARFTLKPSPEAARNAFLPLRFLQKELGLPGRVNALLAGDVKGSLAESLHRNLTLADWNLRLLTPEDRAREFVKFLDPQNDGKNLKPFRWRGRVSEDLAPANPKDELPVAKVIEYYRKHRPYLSLQSQQMFLEPAVVKAATKVGAGDPILIYLADTIAVGKNQVPYAIVAGVKDILGPKDIAIATWPKDQLHARIGEKALVTYYVPDDQGRLHKKQESFVVAGTFPLEGNKDDPDLTPQFPGITDQADMKNWENPPFPFKPQRIKLEDEEYWKRYRTTPRAYVNLATAQKLWGSRFGNLTSLMIRLMGPDAPTAAKDFSENFLAKLDPAQGGFVFQDVKQQGLKAGAGSTDFGMLFLGFSFFLIVAGLLLVGLLFRLNLDRRAPEIGLLLAVGFDRRAVRRLLLGEGFTLALIGGLVGAIAATVYARWLLDFLSASWPGEEPLTFLHFHARPWSFLIGYISALAASLLTILWATRALAKVAPKALLAGETTVEPAFGSAKKRPWSKYIAIFSGVAAVGCLITGFFVTDHEAQAGSFFGSGIFLLTVLLAIIWRWMRGSHRQQITHGQGALVRLGIRNAGRHPSRSLLTAGLLASASFMVVAVQAFHREAGADFYNKDSGSGGFRLLMETDVPIFQDLNNAKAKADLFFPDDPPAALDKVTFYPFRVRAGDDASCLNLYQPQKPRIMGAPKSFINRGGFRFSAPKSPDIPVVIAIVGGAPLFGTVTIEKENPWFMLTRMESDGAIPVFADANTARWILHKGLGDVLEIQDDQGKSRKLRIAGLLDSSIFQSELLVSESHFKNLFPRQEGFSFFLLDFPPKNAEDVKSALAKVKSPVLFISSTAQRLETYLAVENTYLATFQALGGLGLLLGALGLAVVLLRSVWERRGELALLRALGFRRKILGWLVLAENAFLLILGLAVGVLSAILAVAPHLLVSAGSIQWLPLVGLLGLVLLVGLATASAALGATLRASLLPALRRE